MAWKRYAGNISTHALTEGDNPKTVMERLGHISTHALTEGDGVRPRIMKDKLIFQLTPSRRATVKHNVNLEELYISTHALTEGD